MISTRPGRVEVRAGRRSGLRQIRQLEREFLDAVREFLGLGPLYRHAAKDDLRRFAWQQRGES